MFTQSKAYPEMIELIKRLKKRYGLKIIAVSNEARELNTYRIEEFGLAGFIDFFASSTYVHMRKPDRNILNWQLIWLKCSLMKCFILMTRLFL